MCRAAPVTSRKPKRVHLSVKAHIVQSTTEQQPKSNITISLPEECAKTVSVSVDDSLRNSCHEEEERYSAIGRNADVLEDYAVFPTVLGSGHYGTVRECFHRATRRSFAVKSIEKAKVGRLDHLRREVSLLSKMNHHGIMKMVDCYEDADYVHIVTEKYTGGELFDKIIENTSEDGCFSERKTIEIIKSLLESVQYLHDNGIVHRDIKPENVLFESRKEDSAIKLIDFGLSRTYQRGDAFMNNPVGTAYYMSPELLKGKYDNATDVWSVGVVAYVLLCGYPPFNGHSDPDIFDAIKRGHFEFSGHVWDRISDEAKDFIKCLLRRDPRKRFSARQGLEHPWMK